MVTTRDVGALRLRQRQDLLKLLVLSLCTPLGLLKIAREACSLGAMYAVPDAATCAASNQVAYIFQNYFAVYRHLLTLKGDYFWVSLTTVVHVVVPLLAAMLPPVAYNTLLLPVYSSAIATVFPQSILLGLLLLTAKAPTPYTWQSIRFSPLYRLAFSLAFPTSPALDAANAITSGVLCLTSVAVGRAKHPDLRVSWPQQVLLACTCATLLVALCLWRRYTGVQRPAYGADPASDALHTRDKGSQKSSRTAGQTVDCGPTSSSGNRGVGTLPGTDISASTGSIWGDLLCRKRLQRGNGEGQPHPAEHEPGYQGFVFHTPVRLKLEGVEPHQLPPGWCERYAAEVAAQTQGCVVGVYVRQGCIELVVDLVSWAGNGQRGEAGEGKGGSNNTGDKGASPKLDIGRLVQALQLPQPPLSLAAMVSGCPPRPATYGDEQHSRPSAKHLQACRVPHITALQPRVVAVAGVGVIGRTMDAPCTDGPPAEFSLAVLLPQLQGTPTAPRTSTSPCAGQQQEQQGAAPELLLRARGSYLSVTTTAAASTGEGSSSGGSRWQVSGLLPATAAAAEPSPAGAPEPLRILARVSGLPSSPGLLLMDCRASSGPAAPASRCVPVLLVGDAAVAQELQAALEQWHAPLEELDQLVFDLGTWAEYAGQAGAAAAQPPEHTPWSAGAAMWAAGGSSTSRPLAALGAHLLQYALRRGWLHTARWLMRGLQALGVNIDDIVPGTLLARGSPSILRAALTSYRAAVIQQALVWTLLTLLPRRSARRGGHRGRSAQGMHSVWRALRHSVGLEHGSPQEEAALRAYLDVWILDQCSTLLVFSMVSMAWVVWHSVQRSGRLLDAGSLPQLIYPMLGTIVALASALVPASICTRLLSLSATVQHLGSPMSNFLAFCLGHPPTLGTDSYILGAGIVVAEGILLPAVVLLSPATAAILALAKLPLHARIYLKACQLQGLACGGRVRWALLRHACIALLSVATTLACNIYVRLRFTQQKLAVARALKD